MSKRPHMKTTHKQIVDWAMENINSKDSMFGEEWSDTLQKYVKWGEVGYGVDASEMDTHVGDVDIKHQMFKDVMLSHTHWVVKMKHQTIDFSVIRVM